MNYSPRGGTRSDCHDYRHPLVKALKTAAASPGATRSPLTDIECVPNTPQSRTDVGSAALTFGTCTEANPFPPWPLQHLCHALTSLHRRLHVPHSEATLRTRRSRLLSRSNIVLQDASTRDDVMVQYMTEEGVGDGLFALVDATSRGVMPSRHLDLLLAVAD